MHDRGTRGANLPKEELIGSIVRAKGELESTLTILAALPAFDPGTVGYAAHAINNYLTLTDSTLDLLESALAAHPDTDVRLYLSTLRQSAAVMSHTVNQLVNAAGPEEAQLVTASVNLVRLVRVGCDYYQAVAAQKQIQIRFTATVSAAVVQADRVAVAAALDNLLSNAVKY
jgi:signal transduction histidine kinase